MRDPILASKFNRLHLFFCETPTVQVSSEAGIRNGDIKAFPLDHGTNQWPARTGKVEKFAKRDNSIVVYTPNYCRADIEFNRLYTVYLFEGTFSKL